MKKLLKHLVRSQWQLKVLKHEVNLTVLSTVPRRTRFIHEMLGQLAWIVICVPLYLIVTPQWPVLVAMQMGWGTRMVAYVLRERRIAEIQDEVQELTKLYERSQQPGSAHEGP